MHSPANTINRLACPLPATLAVLFALRWAVAAAAASADGPPLPNPSVAEGLGAAALAGAEPATPVVPTGEPQEATVSTAILREWVTNSDIIVVGRLTSMATRDGHSGSIEVSEVLQGNCQGKSIGFVSAPEALVRGAKLIWFLQRQAGTSGSYYLLIRGEASSLAVSERETVLQQVARTRK